MNANPEFTLTEMLSLVQTGTIPVNDRMWAFERINDAIQVHIGTEIEQWQARERQADDTRQAYIDSMSAELMRIKTALGFAPDADVPNIADAVVERLRRLESERDAWKLDHPETLLRMEEQKP